MRTRLILAAALAASLLATAAAAEPWKAYAFPADGVSVRLPAEPRRSQQTDPDSGKVATYLAARADDGRVFVVGVADLAGLLDAPGSDDAFSRGVIVGAAAQAPVIEADHAVKTRGRAGHEAVFRSAQALVRVRAFVSGNRGYTLIVMGPGPEPSSLKDATAEAFFDSVIPTAP